MSQEGLVDIIGTHPEIPTDFIADSGNAVPIANTIELLGAVVAAAGIPFRSVGSGNTITYEVQYASAIAATDATDVGLAAFDSASFAVDANGFVTLSGSSTTSFMVDASTPPGTNPVVPLAGVVTVTGGQVAAGTTANVIRTDSLAANTFTIEIQRSSAQAATTIGANGVSHFNSTQFSVDANGFVSLAGAGIAIDSIGTQTGTNPISPDAAGLVTINGAVVAAGTNPVRTDGTGANTLAVEVQISQALAGTDATRIGLSNFSSSHFAVDANGFVTLAGGGQAIDSFIPDSGTTPVVPAADGSVTMSGSGSITTVGGTNTLTFQLTGLTNHSVLVGAGTTTITKVAPSATAGIPLVSNGAAADPSFSTALVVGGGTGLTSVSQGDLLYGSAANTYSLLAKDTNATRYLSNTGTTNNPAWDQVNLANGVTGNLPVTNLNSGTSASATTFWRGDGSWATPAGTGISTITGDSGGAQSPSAGNFNILGTGSITTVGTANTETIQLTGLTNHALLVGAGTATITKLSVGATGTVLIGNTGADPSFSATPSVTSITLSSGNALSTYIQGTFTPGVAFGGGTTGITYGAQVGQYTRIGNVVYFTFLVQLTSKGSSTGNVTLTGFPVAAAGNQCVMTAIKMTNFTINAGYTSVFTQTQNATNFEFFAHDPTLGDAAVTNTQFANNTDMRFIGFYFSS